MSSPSRSDVAGRGEFSGRLAEPIRRIGLIGTIIAVVGIAAGLLLAQEAESIALGVGVAAAIGTAFLLWAKLRIVQAKVRIERIEVELELVEEFPELIRKLAAEPPSMMKAPHIAEEIADRLETLSPKEKSPVGE